jgi:WD40 repeat protein
MDPQIFALKGSLEEALRNRSLLLTIVKPLDLTHSIIGYCLLPKFLEKWILSDETASEQVIGVLGAMLTIVPPSSTLHDQIRSVLIDTLGKYSLAISRNGSRMAGVLSKSETIADQDFQVSIWLLRDDDQPASYVALKGHTDRVTAVCFHPLDEANVVSASLDQTLRIWDTTGRTCLAIIGLPSAMTQVTYTLDGEAIAGYSKEDNLVQTLKTPKLPYCQHRPLHRMTDVTLLHFSLSGNLIVSTGRDCIHVWKLSTCNRIQTLLTTDKDDRPFSGM